MQTNRLTLENVQTNAAQPVDVGVVDFGKEADFGRSHRVVIWQKELKLEDAAWNCVSLSCRPSLQKAHKLTLVRRL